MSTTTENIETITSVMNHDTCDLSQSMTNNSETKNHPNHENNVSYVTTDYGNNVITQHDDHIAIDMGEVVLVYPEPEPQQTPINQARSPYWLMPVDYYPDESSESEDSVSTSECCKTGLLDCLRNLFSCLKSEPKTKVGDPENPNASLVRPAPTSPYYYYEDSDSDSDICETDGRGWGIIRNLRGLRYRGNVERQRSNPDLVDAFAIEPEVMVIQTQIQPDMRTPATLEFDNAEDSDNMTEMNTDMSETDDNLSDLNVKQGVTPENYDDAKVDVEVENNIDIEAEDNENETSDIDEDMDCRSEDAIKAEIDNVISNTNVIDSDIGDQAIESDDDSSLSVELEEEEEQGSSTLDTDQNDQTDQDEQMNVETIKDNLRVIASLESGNKLYEDYYGRLSVDNSYIQGLTRIISRNSRTNTVSRVMKTIAEARAVAEKDSEVAALLNSELINGLRNLIQTYSESSDVKDSLTTLATDLVSQN